MSIYTVLEPRGKGACLSRPLECDALLLQIPFRDFCVLDRRNGLRRWGIQLHHYETRGFAVLHHGENCRDVDFALTQWTVAQILFAARVVLEVHVLYKRKEILHHLDRIGSALL